MVEQLRTTSKQLFSLSGSFWIKSSQFPCLGRYGGPTLMLLLVFTFLRPSQRNWQKQLCGRRATRSRFPNPPPCSRPLRLRSILSAFPKRGWRVPRKIPSCRWLHGSLALEAHHLQTTRENAPSAPHRMMSCLLCGEASGQKAGLCWTPEALMHNQPQR